MGVVDGNKTSGTCRVILGQGVERVYFTARYKNGTTAEGSISIDTDFCNTEDMDVYQHIHITKIDFQNGYSKWRADITESACSNNSGYVNYASYDLPNGDISGMTAKTTIVAKVGSVPIGYVYFIIISAEKQSLPEYYRLTFDANRGINPPDSIRGYLLYNYEVTIPSTIPERDGYTFKYWTMDKDGMGKPWYPGMSMTLVENTILYAQWEKNSVTGSIKCTGKTTTSLTFEWSKSSNSNDNIKLICNGATLKTESTGMKTSGTVKFTGLAPDTPYIAELWCDGNRIAYCDEQTSSRPKTCTIHYDLNKPSDATGEVTNYPNDESFEDGYAIVSAKTPECAGYRFKEWNTKKDGNGASHSHDQGSFSIVSDITLYAIWQCYICFHGNCNDIVDNIPYNGNKMWYDVGTEFTIPKTEPTRGTGAEWSFLYWESSSIGICYAGVTIALTESVDLYAKWERNAKLAKPIVTKHSKTETSITVRVDKNDGYGGTWCVRIWKNGNGSWGNYLQATGDLAELPSNITFYNLDSSTLYDIQAVHSADGLGALYSEARSIRTNIPAFYWTGSNENDATYITKGKDLSGTDEASPLKAEKWNELTKLIQTCQTINSGGNTYFTSASKGTEITAQIFNEVAYALGDLNGGVIPAKGEPVKVGEDILASYFAGYGNSLKETINGISENINKKT